MSAPPDFRLRRIGVALSGGVDSAAAAALLKEQGHDVLGLTMLLKPEDTGQEARRVAEALGIPFHVFDARAQFAACVVEPFVQSYLRGETPNPCVLCNKKLKFGDLAEEAKKLGAEALATGHYARRVEGLRGAELHAGADGSRDQSYFLFALSRAQLDFLRFPLSEMTKKETRALAAKHRLPVAEKPDSQDICFVPDGDYVAVLQKLHPNAAQAGEIVDEAGRVLGKHEGIIHFTVGQRRGLNISDRKGDNNEPLFVLKLDAARREVVVGPRERLAKNEVFLRDVNWLADEISPDVLKNEGIAASVRLRSAQEPAPARFFLVEQRNTVMPAKAGIPFGFNDLEGFAGLIRLAAPACGVSPGQAGVIYAGGRVLGGGWIAKST